MVTKRRHALSAETIRANSLVASWTKEGLVPVAKVRAALGSRKSRKKKLGTEDNAEEEDMEDIITVHSDNSDDEQ